MNDLTPVRDYIYPGHPIVIGFCVLKMFPSAQEALKPDAKGTSVSGPSAMVASATIPGGGDAVYDTDYMLRSIWNKLLPNFSLILLAALA